MQRDVYSQYVKFVSSHDKFLYTNHFDEPDASQNCIASIQLWELSIARIVDDLILFLCYLALANRLPISENKFKTTEKLSKILQLQATTFDGSTSSMS